DGTTLTITFSETGIIWGGIAGNSLNNTTSMYQGTGYTFVWIANNGTISYKYSYNNGAPMTTPAVYTYALNSSGELELRASGYLFATLVKGAPGGDPGTPGGSLTNDIDAALFGTWKDNIGGTTVIITFSEDGITWAGTAGDSLNSTTSMYQGTGYTFVWIANNGTISYKYSYNNGTPASMPVYTYALNSSGELELKVSGYLFVTLVNEAISGGNTYTITFDANDGGSGGPTSVKVEYEQPMPDLSGQTLPTRAGVRHVFTGYFDAQTGGTKYYNNNLTSARDWDKESDATLYAQWAMDYEIGDVGPGGGIIFYVSEAGFTVTNYGTAHYLEAAPADMAEWLEWDEYGTLIDGTGRGIGSGRDNTDHILNIVPTAPAALACRNYTGGGKTDWFLPSLDELNELYVQKDIVGGFTYDFYWSSSEYYSVYAYDQLFGTGVQSNYYKGETYSVRAVRAF
ncbi:MAG: InlB B-repeat-containing protein, partial [Leptospirales bacterium]|nr:InlB B-repeat-containing protein [Leptospirales bacterium]